MVNLPLTICWPSFEKALTKALAESSARVCCRERACWAPWISLPLVYKTSPLCPASPAFPLYGTFVFCTQMCCCFSHGRNTKASLGPTTLSRSCPSCTTICPCTLSISSPVLPGADSYQALLHFYETATSYPRELLRRQIQRSILGPSWLPPFLKYCLHLASRHYPLWPVLRLHWRFLPDLSWILLIFLTSNVGIPGAKSSDISSLVTCIL